MKTFGLSILAVVLASPSFPQTPPMDHTSMNTLGLPVTIDGAKNPERIDDALAYRHFGLHFAQHEHPSEQEVQHLRHFKRNLHMGKDFLVLQAAFAGVRESLDRAGTDQPKINALVDAAIDAARHKMSLNGLAALDAYVQGAVKPSMKVFGGKHVHPNQNCVCNYDVIYSFDFYEGSTPTTVNLEIQYTDDSGCNHSEYSAKASMTPPGGSQVSQVTAGMSSTVSAQITTGVGVQGDWVAEGNATFYCPCVQNIVTTGSGTNGYIKLTNTYFVNPDAIETSDDPEEWTCTYTIYNCSSKPPSILPPSCTEFGGEDFNSCPIFLQAGFLKVSYSPSGNPYICFQGGAGAANPNYPGGSPDQGPGLCN